MQSSGSSVFCIQVDIEGCLGNFINSLCYYGKYVVRKGNIQTLSAHQIYLLHHQIKLRLFQYPHELWLGYCLHLDSDGQPTKQLRNQIGWFGLCKSTTGYEQHMVCSDVPVFRIYYGALDQRQ